jgi:hypothetical protein
MAWKSSSWSSPSTVGDYSPRHTYSPHPEPTSRQTPQNKGKLIASIGEEKSTESLYKIDDELCGYNLSGNKVLIRLSQNDTAMEQYIGLSFTKGVTERETGRTMLILGSNAHHIEVMQGQFEGVLWTKKDEEEIKKFGDTIRWINVGDTKNGFLGVDYNPQAPADAGVARTPEDILFLSNTLLEYGYDKKTRLFVLKPPYIQERPEGKALRKDGLETIAEIAKADKGRLAKLLRNRAFDVEVEETR